MTFLKYLKILLLLTCLSGYGQNNLAADIAENYGEHFNSKKERIYLHLNKTSFLPKEILWFSAYAYYAYIQEPCRTTSTLSVAIYNDQGKLLEDKLIFLDQGTGGGYFELNPKTFPPGNYFVRALTPYLKNFKEDHSYLQKITILGAERKKAVEEQKFDLQLLPESGHLLEDTENTVAVKLIDNSGKGVAFSKGTVFNGKGEPVRLFRLNQFGMGKFDLTPTPGENYKIEVPTSDGQIMKQNIPDPEPVGINLTAGTTEFGQYLFTVRTNDKTLPELQNKDFVLAIHQEGKMKAFNFSFKDSSQVHIKLAANILYTGTNIVTVFNEDQKPIVERLIFNRNGILRQRVNAVIKKKVFDSLQIEIKSQQDLSSHNLSLSVLPGETRAYNPEHNIFSAVYLKPYIKGSLEDGGYYFSPKGNRTTKDRDLDLLLLTQGWNQYSWKDIFRTSSKEHFPHQMGFTIKGKINDPIKNDHHLIIGSPSTNLWEEVEVSEEGDFELDHALVIDSSSISFTLVRENNQKPQTPSVSYNILPRFKADSVYAVPTIAGQIRSGGELSNVPEEFIRDAQVLDTIFLEEKYQPKEGEMIYLKKESTTTKTIISEREEQAFYHIVDYIAFQGFKVKRDQGGVMIFSQRADILLVNKPWELVPVVTIDGIRLPKIGKFPDFSRLVNMTTKEVKSIKINKSGAGLGFGGAGGWIEIETRKNPRRYDYPSGFSPAHITNNGYHLNKKYYTPKYSSYSSPYFERFGTLGWFSNLQLEEGKKNIKILNTLQPEVRLFIEGMTQEGYLISEEILLNTQQTSIN